MNLLLFGGTFDPPHKGHIALLQSAIKQINPQKVLIIPAGMPPHKRAFGTPAFLRAKMCKCFLSQKVKTKIDYIEINRSGASYTITTVQALRKQYPNSKIYFCLGSDMLLYFPKWYQWQKLLSLVTIVVLPRNDEDLKECEKTAKFLQENGGKVIFAQNVIVPVSSTQIRNNVKQGESISKLVPKNVEQIINKYNLYKGENQQ